LSDFKTLRSGHSGHRVNDTGGKRPGLGECNYETLFQILRRINWQLVDNMAARPSLQASLALRHTRGCNF
jgi:hydroxypyruvate isomerase